MHGLKSKAQVATQLARDLIRRLIFRCTLRPPGSRNLPSLLTSSLVSRAKLTVGPSVLITRFISAKFEQDIAAAHGYAIAP
jgi:hypothetical protein